MHIMNNIIKYIIFYTWVLAVIQVIALPTYSKVIEPKINHEVISEENIHTESNEDFNNEEADVNRSKKSTTFCVEIKSGTPECVPCQPVIMEPQPQVVYVTNNNTSSDSNMMNNTVLQRRDEVLLPPEPCEKSDTYLIISPQQVKPTISMVQVPVVHPAPQSPQIILANKPFLQENFPELLNGSQVQIQPLTPFESLPMNDQQFSQLFQPSNTYDPTNQGFILFEPPKDQEISGNLRFGGEVQNQPPFPQPLEYQYMGKNFANQAVPQQHPSSIGSLENHRVNTNSEFGAEMPNQPPFPQPLEYQYMGKNFANQAVPQQHPSPIGSLENHRVNTNLGFGGDVQNQPPFPQPLEYQYTGKNFANQAVPQQHPSPIGSLENHRVNTNSEFGAEMPNQPPFLQPSEHQNMGQNFDNRATLQQHPSPIGMKQNYGFQVQHQPPFMINQQRPAFNTRVQPPQQNLPLLNDYASGWKFANGEVGQLPIQDPIQSQRPVNDFQMQQGYLTNMNFVMGQDGMGYLVPVMINGSPQPCLQPELPTNPPLDNINQQSSTQQQKLSTPDTQQSSSIIKQSREIKDSKGTLKSPEVQTTVASIKSGLKSQQDVKGKGGPSSQLNHLKGSSPLSKSKTLGKGQNKDSRTNEKLELKRGIKRETEISVDK